MRSKINEYWYFRITDKDGEIHDLDQPQYRMYDTEHLKYERTGLNIFVDKQWTYYGFIPTVVKTVHVTKYAVSK